MNSQSDARPARSGIRNSRRIEVAVANECEAAIDEDRIRAAVIAALGQSDAESASVSVAVVDDEEIRRLNVEFLGHDYATDVLSFLLEADAERLEGEIVVSFDTAVRYASEANWSTDEELLLYVIHGSLHLAGYDDVAPEDGVAMRTAELAALAAIGVAPSRTDRRWLPEGRQQVEDGTQ